MARENDRAIIIRLAALPANLWPSMPSRMAHRRCPSDQ